VALIAVGDRVVKRGTAVPPNETPVTVLRFVPVIVTVFPPASGPEFGIKELIDGWETALYVYETPVTPSPAGPDTVTVTVPLPGGAVAVIEASETTENLGAGVVPKFTLVAYVKPVPINATLFPPAAGPLLGFKAVTAGRATAAS
jgi:hypothetical protein